MCGIAGIFNLNKTKVATESIKDMMQKIKHRGPDDEGVFIDNEVGLGFVRLSIIDLSAAGHQPMLSADGRYVIVFNGEIYNYLELKEELKGRYEFKTKTDTEVILAAYQIWGENCLDHFNGMFAFVIYDKQQHSFFGARDRFGVKPFYYYKDADVFCFASEIPAVLTALPEKPKANNQVIFDYLTFNRTDQTDQTFFTNVLKLQHGHKFTLQNGEFKISKWYDLKVATAKAFDTPKEFGEMFNDSIKMRLRADVPVGVCLSGGLDSSSIVSSLYKNFNKTDLNTFSAVFGGGETGDESKFIDLYKDQLKNMFYVTPTAKSLMADKEKFILAHAEPIPSTSPYAQYKLMELASEHVVVTLDGQGADEFLAGYHYFFGFYFKELFRKLRFISLIREVYTYLKKHNSILGLKTFGYFMLPNRYKLKLRTRNNGYLNQHFINKYATSNAIVSNLYDSKDLKSAFLNHFEYKLEHLLKWSDRNSMRFSVEAREPFLDYRLIEKALAGPSDQKIKNGTTKYILREAMKGVLPEEIRMRQDKVGFDTPENKWFREPEFEKFIKDIIHSQSFKDRPYFDAAKVSALYEDHLSGKINISKDIWKWINLELWFREFID